MLRILMAVALLFVAALTVHADSTTVSVGGSSISLPAPEGFFRYDGKSAKVDAFEQQFTPATNRLLASFGSEEAVAEVLLNHLPRKIDREFSAQTVRSIESHTFTPASFNQMKPELRNSLSSTEKYRSLVEALERNASVAISQNMQMGEIIPLGIFDDTSDSLCFSMLSKVEIAIIPDGYVSITACCVVRVGDRLVDLLVTSPYRDKSDIEWAKRSLQSWRDAVLRANAK
jgi:hypothetical protein